MLFINLKELKEKAQQKRVAVMTALAAASAFAMPELAMAITAPADNTAFAYDLYDVAVNDMLKGPVGFVGGLATIILSAINITKNWMMAGAGVLGGTALIKADSVVTTMGMII
ncbi:hypothetical protein [Endozoicomonas sp. ONNA1]|uniref:hypothetical protein n=1 Tax=Endozoicomonas sp. ONNA1 TaxID=2828740 RepID=UPI00214783FB|nr:hypothetical protein [Endozoicomonas sp. ONNA1]